MNAKYFVPFETAKQLKKKGYDVDCYSYYTPKGKLQQETFTTNNDWIRGGYYIAPTYHEVIDWLREQYGLIVCVGFSVARCWTWSVGRLRENLTLGAYGEKESTREEALNAAILEALKML